MEPVDIDGTLWLAVATGPPQYPTTNPIKISNHSPSLSLSLSGSSGVSLFQWSYDAERFVFNSTLGSGTALRVENIPETGS